MRGLLWAQAFEHALVRFRCTVVLKHFRFIEAGFDVRVCVCVCVCVGVGGCVCVCVCVCVWVGHSVSKEFHCSFSQQGAEGPWLQPPPRKLCASGQDLG